MDWKKIKWNVRYLYQFFPFSLNTFLFIFLGWGVFKLIYAPAPKGENPSPLLPFILIMSKMVAIFFFVIAGLSVISTFAVFFYYLWLQNSKGYKLQVTFTPGVSHGRKMLWLNARLDGVIRPMLGFIKGRLYYDDNVMTDRFGLLSGKRKEQSLWRAAITGKSRMELPDVKEYELKGGIIYFQDMLHIFSLAVPQPVSGHFYQAPGLADGSDADVFPKKTETMDVRIEQLRRVEGEHLNYKDFEAGDDVRRIVWKVYAKNRELMVRVPELYEPYASHLYFYASFYADVKGKWLGAGYLKEMLNYYKSKVWTVYDTLAHKEWQVRYIPDQSFNVPEQMSEDEKAERIVVNSNWHKDRSLQHYFNTRNGAVLCISSFIDPQDLSNILDKCDASTVVYFIKLSDVLKSYTAAIGWFTRIMIRPPKDRLSRLRGRWLFSPMRLQVQKREKEIEELLNRSRVTVGVL